MCWTMATLNLRVSKTKSSGTLKKSSLQTLSEDFLKAIAECSCTDHCNDFAFLNELKAANSLDTQVNVIKLRIENELNQQIPDKPPDTLRFQMLLYLNLSPKNILKARLLKMLKIWSENDKNCMKDHMYEIMSSILRGGKLKRSVCVKNLVTLLEYFDNNSDFLLNTYPLITDYIKALLKTEVESIVHSESSSLQKLYLYEFIHDSVRALLLIIHADFENRGSNVSTKVLNDEKFMHILKMLVHHFELPLDTKLNCGLLYMRVIFKAKGASACVGVFFEHCLRGKNQNSLAKICYCAPLLNIFTIPALSNVSVSEQTQIVDDSLFWHVCSFLFSMSETFATENNTVLALNRTLETLAEHLAQFSEFVTKNLAQLFLNYIWTHIDHYMDTVRHRTKTIFEHFISFSKASEVDTVDLTLMSLASAKMTSKFFCIGIQLVSTHVQMNSILLKFPDFIQTYVQAFEEMPASTHLVSAFNLVMCSHLKHIDLDDWISSWVDPVLDALDRNQTSALEQVLNKAAQCAPQSIERIVQRERRIFSYSTLICLHIGIKSGLIHDHFDNFDGRTESWRGLIPYDTLCIAVSHQNENVRLLVFQLLTESKKITQFFRDIELSLISSFLKYNCNNQNSAFRQKFLSYLKKFLLRYRDSFSCLQKSQNENFSDASKKLIEAYNRFREDLILICSDNLFPSANFGRRCTVLKFLKLCFDENIFRNDVFPSSLYEGLLYCLNDTYEENKALARQNLLCILNQNGSLKDLEKPQEIFKKHFVYFELFEVCKKLVSSTHPSDCVTAAYFLGFFIDKFQSESTNPVIFQNTSEKHSYGIPEGKKLYLCEMVNLLEDQIQIAEKNMLEAAVNSPVYGVIYVIRHLLSSVDMQAFNVDPILVSQIPKIIQLCFRASSAVSHIVNNLSPEGHLPMDFTVVENIKGVKAVKSGVTHATSQLLLLCAWRTIKEISLLFGELIEKTPIVEDETQGFMTDKLLLEIGSYFMTSLSEIKHRGAFEQAYVGFSKICLTLWKCSVKKLSELPEQWLKEMIAEITSVSNKFCSTRRSAGVPYIVQALLVSEHQISPSSNCFHSAMNQLLSLCESEGASSKSKIHALNVLRSLFRSTELGEQVNTYVARAVRIAVLGFNSSLWSERNSSTLLLSALLVRIFGVPRSKDSLTWKNKMTGRIFFMRYPSLYEFFLSQLVAFDTNINNLNKTNTNELTIFPILLVLSRIYPSSLEGTDSNLQLSNYVKYVHNASRSRIHDVRVLAATAISSLITTNSLKECVEYLFNDLNYTELDNVRHGTLLQLSQIVLTQKEIPERIQLYIHDQINQIFPQFLSANGVCWIIKDSFLKFVFYSIIKCNYSVKPELSAAIYVQVFSCSQNEENIVGKNNFNVTAVLFLAHYCIVSQNICKNESNNPTLSGCSLKEFSCPNSQPFFFCLVSSVLKSSMFDSIDTILVFLFYALLFVNEIKVKFSLPKNECEDLNAFIVINHDVKFFKFVFNSLEKSADLLKLTMKKFLNSETLRDQLVNNLNKAIAKDKHHLYEHKYLALLRFHTSALDAYCGTNMPAFTNLSKSCFRNNDDSVTVQALHCISSYLICKKKEDRIWSQGEFEDLSKILFKPALVLHHSDQIRYAISQIIVENYSLFCDLVSSVNLLNLMTTIIHLLLDDLAPIRENIARILGTIYESSRNLELMLEEFRNNRKINTLLFAVATTTWMLKDIDHMTENENQEKVFDKTDMNVYFEDIMLTKLAACHLSEIFSNESEIAKIHLPEPVKEWMWNFCTFEFDASNTLFDIFSMIVSKFHFEPESYLLLLLNSNLKNSNAAKKIMCLAKLKYIRPLCAILKSSNNKSI